MDEPAVYPIGLFSLLIFLDTGFSGSSCAESAAFMSSRLYSWDVLFKRELIESNRATEFLLRIFSGGKILVISSLANG